MRRVRRVSTDVRLELTPLIDVVFLLITFFLFALLVMVRARVLDVNLPELRAGAEAAGERLVTLAVRSDGGLVLEGEAVGMDAVTDAIEERMASAGEGARLVLAVDEGGRSGVLLELADALVAAGITDFSIIGTPSPPAGLGAPGGTGLEPVPGSGPESSGGGA